MDTYLTQLICLQINICILVDISMMLVDLWALKVHENWNYWWKKCYGFYRPRMMRRVYKIGAMKFLKMSKEKKPTHTEPGVNHKCSVNFVKCLKLIILQA